VRVRLLDIAHARSGDKGDTANVGVIALRREWYPILAAHLTAARVAEHFRGMLTGGVERFELPNLSAVNFLLVTQDRRPRESVFHRASSDDAGRFRRRSG
jgi:hypothetical protein